MHFTPTYSSQINQIERLIADITRGLLQRPDHHTVQSLERDFCKLGQSMNRKLQALYLS
ncbi:hypothetical protein HMPREF9597_00996 [Cutibacterium acnes HL005PA4]|nr:hypothetical protein HMPREF0675_3485 [Cutibacterium acnes SK137]AEE71661.1 transposase-like protein [Cutibacterium acnes 266]AEW78532.1 hypothetical protein TIA2EST2_02135 [Cutibacterium acnes TypeIA2 P.acn33]AEW80775.1 hypothetical protein TIA2EST22_02215 [Cutibacterium acnes TypeIA2 P.acn17]AEW83039.1 hypothetical protein TIA2EST36_02190 [Cutibacterium acnes TypeIA2 P.acn31]AFU40230.1 transposase-like protein [Cutibacterium acnes C1]EFD06547.1 hypothetical protein HMPREF9207_2351 [Cutiba